MKRLLCVALAILLLCGCTAAPAQTTISAEEPVLKAGFYIYDGDMGRETLVHFCFQEDGTGYLSMLGNKADLTWTPDGTIYGLLSESVQKRLTKSSASFSKHSSTVYLLTAVLHSVLTDL